MSLACNICLDGPTPHVDLIFVEDRSMMQSWRWGEVLCTTVGELTNLVKQGGLGVSTIRWMLGCWRVHYQKQNNNNWKVVAGVGRWKGFDLQTIIMIKSLIGCLTNKYLIRTTRCAITTIKATLHNDVSFPHQQQQKKAYQILLENSLDDLIKFPNAQILKVIRSRGITKLMANNNKLQVTEQVLEAHVQCLYVLIQRGEPSIEAISMFAYTIYANINHLIEPELTEPIFLNLLKPRVLTKLVKIAHAIDGYYNQAFRSLISLLLFRLLAKSNINQQRQRKQLNRLSEEAELARVGKAVIKDSEGNPVVDSEGNPLKGQYLEVLIARRTKEIKEQWLYLEQLDYWNSFYYILSTDYYSDTFLQQNIIKLEKQLEKDVRTLPLTELMAKIKCLVELHRFKEHKSVGKRGLKTLSFSYGKLIDQYFKVLSHPPSIFQIINHEESIIQTQLLTNFLTQEHYEKAKKIYLEIFRNILNTSINGALLADVKRLKGIFEVALILFTHQDTQEVHGLLAQLERIMTMYPIERFENLEIPYILAEKFGYKSQYMGEKFLRMLLKHKEKLQRNRGHIHQIHQSTRQINLAKKLMLCSRLMYKSREIIEQLVGQLFQPNLWTILSENNTLLEYFITTSSFSHYIYFLRTGIQNITTNAYERRKIQRACLKAGLKNFNRLHAQLMEDLRNSNVQSNSLTLDHASHWRHNPHARLLSLIELANFHHSNLKRKAPQEAINFIEQFLAKTLGSGLFYNVVRQRYAYPGLFESFLELMQEASIKNFPVQHRDLEAVKQLYHSQLTRLIKEAPPTFCHYYQERLQQIEMNRVRIPFTQQVYGLGNLGNCAARSLLCQALRRFEKQKEYMRMQIQTFLKFNKRQGIQVATNYLQLPHLADLIVRNGDLCTVALFHSYEGQPKYFLNWKQLEMQREAESHWRRKGYYLWIIKSEKDLQDFVEKVVKRKSK